MELEIGQARVDQLEIRHEVVQLRVCEGGGWSVEVLGVSGGEHVAQGRGRAVVEVGRSLPDAEQGGCVDASELGAEATSRKGGQCSHVVELALGAVGEVGAGVARVAAELGEESLAALGRIGQFARVGSIDRKSVV